MKKLLQASLILLVHTWVISAKRRRIPFVNCPQAKPNDDLMTTKPARSIIECSVICLNDPHCLSASYCKTTDGYTCQLSGFYTDGSCSGPDADDLCSHTVIVNPCDNGGTFYPQNRTCHCVEGFVGNYCQRRYRDCVEIPSPYRTYIIEPLGSGNALKWTCSRGGYSITRFGSYEVNSSYTYAWQAVKQALPRASGTYYFIGLERLHLFTKQGRYDMYATLIISNTELCVLWYRNARVGTEAEGYALHWGYVERDVYDNNPIFLDGLGGTGDATKNLNGARFGTYDNDVNGCAQLKSIAWWYNPQACMVMDAAPNGMFWPVDRNGTAQNEFLRMVAFGLQNVHFYDEEDLVL